MSDDLETGAHARGVDLFDDPLECERGFVQIQVGEKSVDTEHRVEYDHDPPVELDARFFGRMTELSLDFEFAHHGRATMSIPNDEMRRFIERVAPEVGLRVADVDATPREAGVEPCTYCGDPTGGYEAVYDAGDDDHDRPYCSSRCWAKDRPSGKRNKGDA